MSNPLPVNAQVHFLLERKMSVCSKIILVSVNSILYKIELNVYAVLKFSVLKLNSNHYQRSKSSLCAPLNPDPYGGISNPILMFSYLIFEKLSNAPLNLWLLMNAIIAGQNQ